MSSKFKILQLYLFLACLSLGITGCQNEDDDLAWDWEEEEEEMEGEAKPRYLWVDAAANFPDFANSRDNIKRDLELAKDAGFTDIVVDVRPTDGDVLFQTNVEQQVKSLGAWISGSFTAVERTENWDYLQAFIDAGDELDLGIHAAINTFAGGNRNSLGRHGMLYRDEERKDWGTQLLTEEGIVSTLDQNTTGARFFNPVNEEVQEYLFQLVEDLARYPDLDGIFLDRGRFDGIDSDFSEYTREKFEEYLGFELNRFPEDVMTPEMVNDGISGERPEYFEKWLEFRAKVIHDFMTEAKNRVKSINSKVDFGVYVGGWYSSYYGVGVNWASPSYDPSKRYNWASDQYMDYGYADEMDVILIGAYAAPTNIYGNREWTVEGFALEAKDKIRDEALVIAGPDIGNGAWATSDISLVNQAITETVDAAYNASDGYFLFDMIHLKQNNQWQYVEQGIDQVLSK